MVIRLMILVDGLITSCAFSCSSLKCTLSCSRAVVPSWVLLVEDFLLRIGYRLLIVAHEVDTAVE